MKLFKKLGTYFSMLTLVLSGTSFNSIASEGEEGSEAFDDPDAEASESSGEGSSGNSSGSGAAGSGAAGAAGAGVWVAITGAILGLFSGGSSAVDVPEQPDPPVTPTPTPLRHPSTNTHNQHDRRSAQPSALSEPHT